MTLRVGYFPNITHSQALIGFAPERDDFKKAFGDSVRIETKIFNAGPSVIEAMFAGEIDLAYIGPNPAINGYVKSKGEALRIVAGATSGGAILVARKGISIKLPADWSGKRIASPQLGNTQDVALRYYLLSNGMKSKEQGGTVAIIPTQNPDILALLLKGEIDGAWVPEPWGARLVREAGASIVIDERDLWPGKQFVTANIIVSAKFFREHRSIVKKWLQTHVGLTQWIAAHPAEAQRIANSEIKRLTGKALALDVLQDAWLRLDCTYDPIQTSLFTSADRAFQLGYLGKEKPDLSGIYDLELLNEVLKEANLAQIK